MTICFFVIVHLSSSSLPGWCVTGNGIDLSHSSLLICRMDLMSSMFVADTQVRQEVDGEPGWYAQEEEIGGIASCLWAGRVVGMNNFRYRGLPVCLLFLYQGPQRAQQGPVEPLYLTIPLWMIWTCTGPLYSSQFFQPLKESVVKLLSHTMVDFIWKAKSEDEVIE